MVHAARAHLTRRFGRGVDALLWQEHDRPLPDVDAVAKALATIRAAHADGANRPPPRTWARRWWCCRPRGWTCEVAEHRAGVQGSMIAALPDRGDGDDVAQSANAAGVGVPGAQRVVAAGGQLEQRTSVQVVGQEPGRGRVAQIVVACGERSARI